MKIAVLGLGRMGRAVAQRLIDGGHEVVVWNRSPGQAADLVNAGAVEAGDVAEAVTSTDVVLTSLSNDDAVREVAVGEGGVRSSIGDRPYVDASTISPALSAELGTRFDRFVALPILGAPRAVRQGSAIYLVGGRADVVDNLQPLIEGLGARVHRYPRPEQASSAKLAVNLMLLAGIVTLAEAVTVGRAAGLSDDQLTELLSESPMLAPGLKNRFHSVLRYSGETWWTTVLGAKDARLATETVRLAGKQLRLGPLVAELYQSAAESGLAEDDIAAVARLYE